MRSFKHIPLKPLVKHVEEFLRVAKLDDLGQIDLNLIVVHRIFLEHVKFLPIYLYNKTENDETDREHVAS